MPADDGTSSGKAGRGLHHPRRRRLLPAGPAEAAQRPISLLRAAGAFLPGGLSLPLPERPRSGPPAALLCRPRYPCLGQTREARPTPLPAPLAHIALFAALPHRGPFRRLEGFRAGPPDPQPRSRSACRFCALAGRSLEVLCTRCRGGCRADSRQTRWGKIRGGYRQKFPISICILTIKQG